MKRKQFLITSNYGHNIVKHAWNSSIRAIEAEVDKLACAESTVYKLTSSDSEKEGFYHVRGHRQWTSKAGKVVIFNVALMGEQ